MTAPVRFKKDDIARAVAGASKAGMRVGCVRIDPNGSIIIMSESAAPANEPNPWDEVLGKA